jgi:hypothetical protein
MAKFSVGGVEVIRDDAKIDWSRIIGAPAGIFLNATKRQVGSGSFFSYALESDGAGSMRLVETRYNCDDVAVCACDCTGGD